MPEMKDSGIPWIGKIPEHWRVMPNKYLMYKAKDICPVYHGEDILSLTMNGVIVRDLDAGGKMPTSFDGYQRIYPGNLLMCLFDIDVTPRCIGLIKNEGLTSPAYSQFVLKPIADAAYYCYYYTMLDNDKTLLHLAKNLRHSFTEDQLGAIHMVVPPLSEQKRIATYLDIKLGEIDSMIADAKANIEDYKLLKQSIITQAVTKGLDPDVEMKESGIEWIGPISVGRKIIRLKYTCDILDEYRKPITADQRNQDAEVLYDYYGASGAIDKIDGYTIDDHVMLMGEDGANLRMRNLPLMYEVHGKAWINNHAHILRPKVGFDFKYLFYAFEASDINPYITGSAQPKLNQEKMKEIPVPVPPYEEQCRISAFIEEKCTQIDAVLSEQQFLIDDLEAAKKSLIYECVTGKRCCT